MLDSVGSRLEDLCRRGGVSFRGADDHAGRTPGHCQAIVRGTIRAAEAPTLVAYAKALGCTVGWLIAGEGAAPTDDEVHAAVARARRRLRPLGVDAPDDGVPLDPRASLATCSRPTDETRAAS